MNAKQQYIKADSQHRYKYSARAGYISVKNYSLAAQGRLPAKAPIPYPRITPQADYCIGLEIEVENAINRSRISDILRQYLPDQHYCCADGSLGYEGLEVVTTPIASHAIRSKYADLYNLCAALSKAGCRSHEAERCGLHMHISVKALAPDTWLKLRKFINTNHRLFKRLSRRKNYTYCKFNCKNESERYSALNLSTGSLKTVEFRFWRGTLNPSSFLASIDITLALIEFFRAPQKRYTAKSFHDFLKASKYQIGYKYFVTPYRDTRPKQIAHITAQEREARKQQRAARKIVEQEQLQSTITRHLRRIQSTHNTYVFASTKDVRACTIPVQLTGFNGKITRYFNSLPEESRKITVLADTGINPRYVRIRQTRGWGRTNHYYQFV